MIRNDDLSHKAHLEQRMPNFLRQVRKTIYREINLIIFEYLKSLEFKNHINMLKDKYSALLKLSLI